MRRGIPKFGIGDHPEARKRRRLPAALRDAAGTLVAALTDEGIHAMLVWAKDDRANKDAIHILVGSKN
jgi:hypothetical protein